MTNPEPPKTDPILGAERRETRALSEEKRAQALELFKHGIGYTKASRILNISVNTVRDWSRNFKRGTFRTEISENQYRYPQEVREQVIRLRLSGLSWSEIKKRTGISSSTARKWIDEHCQRPGRKEQLLVDKK
ncbi:helix-turn-helix domain-containing protein [Sutterella faecalis]|uniref:Helix-turn-helix domain-containing protein n=2 Tax=Sutterella TaxID=40544 RepID=A0AAI9WM62_9BURK|nr:helix-turn-helix domain-containing protein [Sutterella faecalis]KAB7649681.1 helix-turn-helix domain-containing protein [Sutterella seckii]QDA53621.1 helix-turn-helix domain-containing protein [Sutterella faecalis]